MHNHGRQTYTTVKIIIFSIVLWAMPSVPCSAYAGTDTHGPSSRIPDAPDQTSKKAAQNPSQKKIDEILKNEDSDMLDRLQIQLTKPLMATAGWMDAFLADDEYMEEINRTLLRIRFGFYSEAENLTPEPRTDLALYLNLPRTENRLQLVVTGSLDTDDAGLTGVERVEHDFETENEAESTVGLRYFLVKGMQNNLGLHAGVSFRDGDMELMGQVRYRYKFDLTEDWDAKFAVRFRQYTARGFETKASLDLERQMGHLFFRTELENLYVDRENEFTNNVNFRLFQPLSEKQGLEYTWANSFVTNEHNSRFDSTKLAVKFRSSLWKEWFFYEIVPQVSWSHKYDWRTNPGILMRLELRFGQDELSETLDRLIGTE